MGNKTLYDQLLDHLDWISEQGNEDFVITNFILKNYITRNEFNSVMKQHIDDSHEHGMYDPNMDLMDVMVIAFDIMTLPLYETFGIDNEWIIIEINVSIKNGTLQVNKSLFGRGSPKTHYDQCSSGMKRSLIFGTVISHLLTYLPEEIDASPEEINEVKQAIKVLVDNDQYTDENSIKSFLESKNYEHFALKKNLKLIISGELYNQHQFLSYLEAMPCYYFITDEVNKVECPSNGLVQKSVQEFTTVVFIDEKVYNRLYLTNMYNFHKLINDCETKDLIENTVVDSGYRRIMFLNQCISDITIVKQLHKILIDV